MPVDMKPYNLPTIAAILTFSFLCRCGKCQPYKYISVPMN